MRLSSENIKNFWMLHIQVSVTTDKQLAASRLQYLLWTMLYFLIWFWPNTMFTLW